MPYSPGLSSRPKIGGGANNYLLGPPGASLLQQSQQQHSLVLRLCKTWDVEVPPAKRRKIAGVMVPTAKAALSFGGRITFKPKRRRLLIEIHGPDYEDDKYQSNDSRGGPNKSKIKGKNKNTPSFRPPLRRASKTVSEAICLSKELKDDDRIVIRVLKPRKMWGFSREPDDSSDSDDDLIVHEPEPEWVEYRKYGVDEIQNMALVQKDVFEATCGLGANQERRQVRFESEEQASNFFLELSQLKALAKERAQKRLEAFQSSQRRIKEYVRQESSDLPPHLLQSFSDLSSDIELLIEVVSATNLPVADRLKHSSDPYIEIFLGSEEIHRTRWIPRTLNPVWTIETDCLCLLTCTAEEFFQAALGLTFVLKDKESMTTNHIMATTSIPQSKILKLTGDERVALPLHLQKAHKYGRENTSIFPPTLYIRARQATPKDRQFIQKVFEVNRKKMNGVYASQTFVGPRRSRVLRLKREKKIVEGIVKHRVKPGPDPSRPEQETKWLSSEDLLSEIMKPTQEWIEAGTGTLGRLFVEVLKCEALPNMDANKVDGVTDAFCCIMYEDSIVNTDVINDTLKPRWVPWCNRGFMFHVNHPSSQILIGVFDYDSGTAFNMDSHDAIGRVSIDVTNFRFDTEYVLTYDLQREVLANERRIYGTITVRLRIQYDSYRDMVIGSLRLPPINHVNLPSKQAFKTSYFVVHGEENLEHFDMAAVTAYRTELQEYLVVWYYIKKAAIAIFLWRGHRQVTLGRLRFSLPLHSAVAFFLAVTVIEDFNLIPSYALFCIAWLLIATNEHRQKHPSPWHGSMTFLELWHALLVNKAPPVLIDPQENEGAVRAYEKAMKERKECEMRRAEEAAARAEKIDAFFSEERQSAHEAFQEDAATRLVHRPTINPLAKYLLPIQQYLGVTCKTLRVTSSVVMWDESLYAFAITNACLLGGLLLLWIPWSFLIRLSLRLIVWVFMGPWMKLLDIFYVQRRSIEGEDTSEMFQKLFDERLRSYQIGREALLSTKERILKTRALKRYMFGRFVNRIPRLKEYRYPDVPKGESFAKPVSCDKEKEVKIGRRSHGQTLVGHMIPTWGDAVDFDEDTRPADSRISLMDQVTTTLSEHTLGEPVTLEDLQEDDIDSATKEEHDGTASLISAS